jgi:hypothetical protein
VNRRQPDPEHAGPELAHQLPRRLERQPRLPRATWTGERHEPGALVPNERENLRHLLLAPDERGKRHGQVRVRDRPQWRKAIGSELVQRDLRGEVLQPVPAQVEHVLGDQLASRAREQHLAAVGRAHDPSRLVHVRADVLWRIEQRLAGVHTDPDPHRSVGKRSHRLLHRRYRVRRRRERIEQAVAGIVDLVARVHTESVAQSTTVVGQRLLESLGTEIVEQRRRALDIREHERHRSRRLHHHRCMIFREQPRHKPTSTRVARLPADESGISASIPVAFSTRTTPHPALIPQEAAGSSRQSPPIPATSGSERPAQRRESPPIPAYPASAMTGLPRRRSRVRVPSLP